MAHQSWEFSDFPILCNDCLGENPYIRMTNMGADKECKICSRPFSVFRWSPGPNLRFRHTIVCQTCSKIRNCCQACALDLTFNVPVGIRDTVLEDNSTYIPKSNVNRQYFVEKMDQQLKASEFEEDQYAKTDTAVKELVKRVASSAYNPTTTHTKNSIAGSNNQRSTDAHKKLCRDFVRGNCRRGAQCSFLHEIPKQTSQKNNTTTTGNNPNQNSTMVRGHQDRRKLQHHPNRMRNGAFPNNVSQLILTGVPVDINEIQIQGVFQTYGVVKSVKVMGKSKIAIVNYELAQSAQVAMTSIEPYAFKINFNNETCKVSWGKPSPNSSFSSASNRANTATSASATDSTNEETGTMSKTDASADSKALNTDDTNNNTHDREASTSINQNDNQTISSSSSNSQRRAPPPPRAKRGSGKRGGFNGDRNFNQGRLKQNFLIPEIPSADQVSYPSLK